MLGTSGTKNEDAAGTDTAQAVSPDQNTGFGSYRYRTYVLSALTLIYILNFV